MTRTNPTERKTIDGITYTSTKYDAGNGLRFLTRVTLVLGEGGLRALLFSGAASFARALGAMPSGLIAIAEGLSRDPSLPRDLCENLRANRLRPAGEGPVQPVFEEHFAGEYPHLLEVMAFILEHNFAGFSLGGGWIRGSRTAAGTPAAESSSSPTPDEESSPPTSTP